MKSAARPATSPLDSLPEPHHGHPDLNAVRETRDRLSLTFPDSKSPDEIREILFSEVYDYMERNFCLSKNELPQDEILEVVNAYQTGTVSDYYSIVRDEKAEAQGSLLHEIKVKLVASGNHGKIIPPIALNSIFLKPKTGKGLLQTAISNYMASKNWSNLSKEELKTVTASLFKNLSYYYETEMTLEERISSYIIITTHNIKFQDSVDKPGIEDIKERRKKAMKEMNKLDSWPYEINDLALNDKIMECFFERKDGKLTATPFVNDFLTTYFDSAQFGLGNRLLAKAANILANDRFNAFNDFVRNFRRRISEYVISCPYDEGLFLTENGTEAAQLLFSQWATTRDRVLAVNQEYGPILEDLEKKGIEVVRLIKSMKDPDYVDYVRQQLISGGANIVLISDISRFGTIFPFSKFKDLLGSKKRRFRIVVDVCQSIGRKIIDFHGIQVDASIGSCQKGSEIIEPAGLLASQPNFAKDLFSSLKDTEIKGTLNSERLARVGIACRPDLLGGTLPNEDGIGTEDLQKMTAFVQERDRAMKNLSCKFLYMIDWINKKNDGRIKIINPCIYHRDDGSVDTEQVGGIFELKIDGVTSEQIQLEAYKYGVTINGYTGASEEGRSIRIAFHPFMNDEAIKILGYVLMRCCELY